MELYNIAQATKNETMNKIGTFLKTNNGFTSKVIYYAGHGYVNEGYLPIGLATKTHLTKQAYLTMRDINDKFRQTRKVNQKQLDVVVESCGSGNCLT